PWARPQVGREGSRPASCCPRKRRGRSAQTKPPGVPNDPFDEPTGETSLRDHLPAPTARQLKTLPVRSAPAIGRRAREGWRATGWPMAARARVRYREPRESNTLTVWHSAMISKPRRRG